MITVGNKCQKRDLSNQQNTYTGVTLANSTAIAIQAKIMEYFSKY